MRKALARLSPAAAFAWAGNQSLRVLFGWFGASVFFAILYWGMAGGGVGLVSGGDGEVARAYGAFDEERGTASRWTFFIGSNGRILFVDREVSPTSHGGDIVARVQELGMAAAAA